MNPRLSHLAALHGVELEYRDIWGHVHRTPEATLVSLLGAMGIPAASAEEIDASIAAHEANFWRTVVGPTVIAFADETEHCIRLHLPAVRDDAMLRWVVHREDGTREAGTFLPSALAVVAAATVDDVRYEARDLPLALPLPPGYHHLEIADAQATLGSCLLAAVPRECYWPGALEGEGRVWGAAVQLYGVRSERNWGIGDCSDLSRIVQQWGRRGVGFVSVNPLHALFAHDPARASPYSPSSRLFINVLYLDVEAVEEFRDCAPARELVFSAAFQAQVKSLRETHLVDYPAVASAKRGVLELLFAHFRERHGDAMTARAESFRAFRNSGGAALRRYALFEALQEHLQQKDPTLWGWPAWVEAYRDPDSPECADFAAAHAARLEFFEYLQWLADDQLAAVQRSATEIGVMLCNDLAVSIDRGGAEAWANQALYGLGASVGAPPDEFSPKGQDWGLPPIVPGRLRAAHYAPFTAMLRANMRHAGALRIDHVMGLARLFWVPDGGVPADGAYVRYPFSDLLGIIALESQRNRCLVIGEDLGTVPDEVRTALGATGALSYRLLYFERNSAGDFSAPADYPAQALAAASTHDLPTLAGWWTGRDITRRAEVGALPSNDVRDAQARTRAQDRTRLLLALDREGLLPPGATLDPLSVPEMTPALARAIALFLARTPAKVMVVQLEDVLGISEQVNLPGTTNEHPNWRRKLPLALERWSGDERFIELMRALAATRGNARNAGDGLRAIIPRATYRLQLHREFGFADAAALVPYLAELGVSHIYCSPFLRARAGSRHGYDIVDHGQLNPEIGTREDFDRFVETLRNHSMGQIVDVVPNHMAVMGADNAWWIDVLENGPASTYATYFDIDWYPLDPSLAGKVLVPILGDHYGNVLERGELVLAYEPEAGSFAVNYHAHRFPIDPREYPRILVPAAALLTADELRQEGTELESVIAALGRLPPRDATAVDALAERRRDKEIQKTRLARLTREHPAIAEAIARAVTAVNGVAGKRESLQAMDALLEAQAFRPAYWRVAADEINYRRFFHINELAALRAENEAVFEATHRFVLDLAADGVVDGLRIDHPDGLYDPAEYFRRVQQRYAQLADDHAATQSAGARPLYVVAEKIMAPHEQLPRTWPVHGTTGYRFGNVVNGLYVDVAAQSRVDRAWRAFVRDEATDFADAAYQGKRLVMKSALSGELTVLANRAVRIARSDWRTRDFTLNSLRQAIAEVVAGFSVYRTYIAEEASAQDEHYVNLAIAQAKRRSTAADLSVFNFVRDLFLARPPADATPSQVSEYRAFAMHVQQFTAPVMAKGVEDTAFYVFNRLVSLNDVGGDPDDFGTTVAAFHDRSAVRAANWPHTMLATSTHDSKRSEDVRARIDAISELPAEWRLAVRRWTRLNRGRKRKVDGRAAPSRNDEYLLYQTLVGTFPAGNVDSSALAAYRERIGAYMLKAVREAKVRTSWISPNEAYESAVAEFVHRLLSDSRGNAFLDDFRAQLPSLAWFGALNSVSMTLVKFTSPGVPDIYQGQELIELALVDPDNRRAVDYASRREALAQLKALASVAPAELPTRVNALLATPEDGLAKLWVIWRALEFRRKHPALFASGDYEPIEVTGTRAGNVVAYSRRFGSMGIVAAAGRLFAKLALGPHVLPVGAAAWADTALELPMIAAQTRLEDVLTGRTLRATRGALPLAEIFAHLPMALLVYETS